MYFSIDIDKRLAEHIKQFSEEAIIEKIKNEPELLKEIIKDSVKGAVKSRINEILKQDEYKDFLKDKVVEYLKNGF